jgi:hypothetical protein
VGGGPVVVDPAPPLAEPEELPSADLTVEELMAEEEEVKAGWGIRTVGGQPSKVSH